MQVKVKPSFLSAKFCFLMEAHIMLKFGDISIRAQYILFVLQDLHMTTWHSSGMKQDPNNKPNLSTIMRSANGKITRPWRETFQTPPTS